MAKLPLCESLPTRPSRSTNNDDGEGTGGVDENFKRDKAEDRGEGVDRPIHEC